MVNSYQLVNPYIAGKFKTAIKANNSHEAANLFYNKLSQHFNNSVPEFNFTIQKGLLGSGKYYHFQVNEYRNNNEVDYQIKSLELADNEENMQRFISKRDKFKSKLDQSAGGNKKKKRKSSKKKDSDSESESSTDSEYIYKHVKSYLPVNQPIYYWWYDPYIYNLNSVYIPTFYSYVTPYIELSLKV